VIDHGQGVTVDVIAEEECPLVIDGHEVIGLGWLAAYAQWMGRRRASLTRLDQAGTVKNVANGARRRPVESRM